MNDEATDFIQVLTPVDSRSIVGIAGVPDGINVKAVGTQYSPDFRRKEFQLSRSQSHAVQHVREAGAGRIFHYYQSKSVLEMTYRGTVDQNNRICAGRV